MRCLRIVVPFLAIAGALAAQTASNIAAKAESLVQASGIQGTVFLARNGEVVLSKGYGLANIELDVANRPETKFRLGSITKQFTAAAILQLQEAGKLAVGDRISKYIPDSPAAWSEITIDHLLTHTSGIPSFTELPDYDARTWEKTGSPVEFLQRFRGLPLRFAPGTKFEYDNSGYFLLGVIIERASGVSYEDYLRKNVFDRLEMSDSGYDWPAPILKNRAAGYVKGSSGELTNAAFLDMGQPYAAGSLYSTVLDLYKWDRALRSTKVLSVGSLTAMFAPGKIEMVKGISYGYGWIVAEVKGHKAVGHDGGINGFSTTIWRAVDADALAIILSNREGSKEVGKVGQDLFKLLLPEAGK